jgi:uncharacterized protein YlxP (DUF503 family)
MFVGAVELVLLLGDARSLKAKRSIVRSLLAELRRRFAVAAAETGDQDLWRRTTLGVAAVSASAGHVQDVCAEVERWAWSRPEVEVVQVTRWVRSIDD